MSDSVDSSNSGKAKHSSTRVVIIGAGPIGLELAVAFGRHGINFEVVDAGPIGQTMSWWAPQTRWFSSNERISIAGVPLVTPDQSKATREQYLNYLLAVATQFKIPVRTYEPVSNVIRTQDGFEVHTSARTGDAVIACKQVVLAIGGTDFPRRLGVPGEDLPHVDGYLREPHRYFGRKVLIVGGRNSAVEAALRLHHAGAAVSLCYHGVQLPSDGIKYWLRPEIEGLIAAGRIESHFSMHVEQILPDCVVLRDVDDEREIRVPADDVLSLIGYEQDKTLFHKIGVQLVDDSQRPRVNPQTMETSVPGVFVAGTAIAGTQNSRYKTFLENCHEHVDKIVSAISGRRVDSPAAPFQIQIADLPES